jgi:hypothetical protein
MEDVDKVRKSKIRSEKKGREGKVTKNEMRRS